MAEHCMVICGEWESGQGRKWEFAIDKSRMSRIVEVRVRMTLQELKTAVVHEFFPEGVDSVEASLSYWPPNTTELATGITTPPVLVINNGAVVFFFRYFMVSKSMNLFVSFSGDNGQAIKEDCDRRVIGFTTPTAYRNNFNIYDEGFVSARRMSDNSFVARKKISRDKEGAIPGPLPKRRFCESSSGSQAHNGGAQRVGSYAVPFELDEDKILNVVESAEENTSDDREVIPVGYDSELWEPLIDDPLVSSDAADVMCPTTDGFDGKAAALGVQREVLCSTNDAFDHRVRVGGDPYRDGMFKEEASPFTFFGTAGIGSGGEGPYANRDPFVPLGGGQTPDGHGLAEEEGHGQFSGG
ncbi:unnamed protein product [Thlaspi arvense]|uniref:Uncharacterized protein n=1 Tax=Thlaspi arvense TaxID=13288 RepID=A0AAU9ST31_THLAR|nr:unnamed protein product [Thlaspi arvense]